MLMLQLYEMNNTKLSSEATNLLMFAALFFDLKVVILSCKRSLA